MRHYTELWLFQTYVQFIKKSKIGYLSAFCGAVSAGAAAGAGIAFLKGGDYKDISHTIVKRPCYNFRHNMRRSKIFMCCENSIFSGSRNFRL